MIHNTKSPMSVKIKLNGSNPLESLSITIQPQHKPTKGVLVMDRWFVASFPDVYSSAARHKAF
jgi:hypothetical protein